MQGSLGDAGMRLFEPQYKRVLVWSSHAYAERYLAVLSFAESSFLMLRQ